MGFGADAMLSPASTRIDWPTGQTTVSLCGPYTKRTSRRYSGADPPAADASIVNLAVRASGLAWLPAPDKIACRCKSPCRSIDCMAFSMFRLSAGRNRASACRNCAYNGAPVRRPRGGRFAIRFIGATLIYQKRRQGDHGLTGFDRQRTRPNWSL